MKYRMHIYLAVLILLGVICPEGRAWEKYEHRQLSDSALFTVMTQYCRPSGDTAILPEKDSENAFLFPRLWKGMTFGEICELSVTNDLARNRFHVRGESILEQLKTLTVGQLDSAWNKLSLGSTDNSTADSPASEVLPPDLSSGNVVSTYLIYHLLAIRMVESAAASQEATQNLLGQAMVLEAVAQGYLADAFSAGHIMTPVSDEFAPLHPRNTKETHNFYRNHGVYVVNSRGDVWQTFGNRLMQWYAPTYQNVFSACCSSLLELLAIYYQTRGLAPPPALNSWLKDFAVYGNPDRWVLSWLVIRDGDYYYDRCRMPTLMLLPMPVVATWSFRTEKKDEHGIRRHLHFPQLREAGFHDPTIDAGDKAYLYSRSAVPDWLIPPPLNHSESAAPDYMIKQNPDWASVFWIQNQHVPPSYKGLLFHVGGHWIINRDDNSIRGMAAIGYGLWDDLLVVRDISVDLAFMPSAYEARRFLLVPSVGFGVPFSLFRWFRSIRIDSGPAFGLRSNYKSTGSMFAIGIDSIVWPFRFTNAGLTCRLKYQWFDLDRSLSGPALEFILQ